MPELYDQGGQRLTLGPRLGRGGEGEVFEVAGQPGLVAKVLHPAGRTRAKLDKVEAMLAQPPAGADEALGGLPVLTWPRTLLHSRPTGQGPATFVGYAMARIAPRDFVPFYQLTSAGRRMEIGGNAMTWDKLVVLGMRLCHVVRTLHRFGYAIGDLNDRNVLVSRRLTPLLMDTDSFQVPKPGRLGVGHFPSVVGDQQYWPPELLAVDLAAYKGSRETGDRFALAVLLFQLFMGGMRPYQSRGSLVDSLETLADKTKAGHYPWDSPKKGVLEPPASAPAYRALPKPIRQAFERCFVDGHRSPSKRPTADDWYAALAKVKDTGFQTCKAGARHVFAAGAGACPWCLDANDPFRPGGLRGRLNIRRPLRPANPTLPDAKAPSRRKGSRKGSIKAAARKGPPQWTAASLPQPAATRPAATSESPRSRPAKSRPVRTKRRWLGVRRNAMWLGYSALSLAVGMLAWSAG